nr:class I SAM-dependent methyltransferase [Chloroflexota bacterium]
MAIYDQYARVYDESGQIAFSLKMIPYLDELLQRHPVPARSMLDLACGTGTVAVAFAQQGWEVYGVDASAGMLEQARRKAAQIGQSVTFSQQDMRQFVLPHAVGLVSCLYDSLNYMLTLADLQLVFQRVAAALLPNGVFMGDMNTREMLEHVWDNNTFFVEGKNLAIVMVSSYDPEMGLSTVDVVGFVRQENGLYERFEERHMERAYENMQVRAALERAGLRVEAAYECFSFDPPDEETRRILWVARAHTNRDTEYEACNTQSLHSLLINHV